jgi:hypothetical protein
VALTRVLLRAPGARVAAERDGGAAGAAQAGERQGAGARLPGVR